MGLSSVSMEEDDRMPQPRATMGSYSVCREKDDMEEDDLRLQYFRYEKRFRSGSAMGRILLVMVLLAALAALVVGAVKLLVWLVHLCAAIHVPIWLADFCDSPTAWVIDAWNSIEMPVLLVVGISLALLILLYGGLWVFGFVHYGIALGSYAAMWMSAIGNVVAGSLYSLLQMISMGGIPVFTVLLCIVVCVALVVGAFEIFGWLVHSGALHTPLLGWWIPGTPLQLGCSMCGTPLKYLDGGIVLLFGCTTFGTPLKYLDGGIVLLLGCTTGGTPLKYLDGGIVLLLGCTTGGTPLKYLDGGIVLLLGCKTGGTPLKYLDGGIISLLGCTTCGNLSLTTTSGKSTLEVQTLRM